MLQETSEQPPPTLSVPAEELSGAGCGGMLVGLSQLLTEVGRHTQGFLDYIKQKASCSLFLMVGVL